MREGSCRTRGSLTIVQNGCDVNLGLVVSTLGRAEPLERLLRSLSAQVRSDDRLVLVAQDRVGDVERLVERFRDEAFRIDVTTSARGASRGRNAGVAALPVGERLLHFPNDTTWFPEGSLDAIRSAASEVEAGALTVIDEHGPKFELPAAGTPLDRWNAWSVIEMGLLVRRSVFDELGGFDPDLGTGAPTPWQAGEATDLLLRLLDRRPDLASGFRWMPPEVAVGGIADPAVSRPANGDASCGPTAAGWAAWWWGIRTPGGGGSHSCSAASPSACGIEPPTPSATGGGSSWVARRGCSGRTIGGPTTAVTR